MIPLWRSNEWSGTIGENRIDYFLHSTPYENPTLFNLHLLVPFCRGMSSAHAIFITIMSFYLLFFSDLFSDRLEGPVTFRSSNISTFSLGVRVAFHFCYNLFFFLCVYLRFVFLCDVTVCDKAWNLLLEKWGRFWEFKGVSKN